MKFLSLLCMAGMALATPLNKTHHARIVGGVQVLPGDVRFMAAVENGLDLLPSFQCGGVILNANTILTVFRCGFISDLLPDLLNSRVRVGSLKSLQGGQRILVSQKTIIGTMAVLKLSSPINMTDPQVAAINLSPLQVQTGWQVNTAGWGNEAGGLGVDLRNVTQVTVRPHAVCENNSPGYNFNTKFCAGYYSGACGDFDRGGPVWFNNGQLAGIAAYTYCNSENVPRFYYKVFPYLSQIRALL